MTLRRILANLLAGIVLAVILFGLVAVIIDERASKHISPERKPSIQEVPFGTGTPRRNK